MVHLNQTFVCRTHKPNYLCTLSRSPIALRVPLLVLFLEDLLILLGNQIAKSTDEAQSPEITVGRSRHRTSNAQNVCDESGALVAEMSGWYLVDAADIVEIFWSLGDLKLDAQYFFVTRHQHANTSRAVQD